MGTTGAIIINSNRPINQYRMSKYRSEKIRKQIESLLQNENVPSSTQNVIDSFTDLLLIDTDLPTVDFLKKFNGLIGKKPLIRDLCERRTTWFWNLVFYLKNLGKDKQVAEAERLKDLINQLKTGVDKKSLPYITGCCKQPICDKINAIRMELLNKTYPAAEQEHENSSWHHDSKIYNDLTNFIHNLEYDSTLSTHAANDKPIMNDPWQQFCKLYPQYQCLNQSNQNDETSVNIEGISCNRLAQQAYGLLLTGLAPHKAKTQGQRISQEQIQRAQAEREISREVKRYSDLLGKILRISERAKEYNIILFQNEALNPEALKLLKTTLATLSNLPAEADLIQPQEIQKAKILLALVNGLFDATDNLVAEVNNICTISLSLANFDLLTPNGFTNNDYSEILPEAAKQLLDDNQVQTEIQLALQVEFKRIILNALFIQLTGINQELFMPWGMLNREAKELLKVFLAKDGTPATTARINGLFTDLSIEAEYLASLLEFDEIKLQLPKSAIMKFNELGLVNQLNDLAPAVIQNFNRKTRAIIVPKILGQQLSQQLVTQEKRLFNEGALTPFLANRIKTIAEQPQIQRHYEAATTIQSVFHRALHHTLPDPDTGFCGILDPIPDPDKPRSFRRRKADSCFNEGQVIGWFKHSPETYSVLFAKNPLTKVPQEKKKSSTFKKLQAVSPSTVRLHTRNKKAIKKTDDQIIQIIKEHNMSHLVPQYLVLGKQGVYIAKNLGLPLTKQIESGNYRFELGTFYSVINEIEQLHKLGWCLRDIKPENSFLLNQEIYFTDLDSAGRKENITTTEGTPLYGSPLVYEDANRYGTELDKLCLFRTLFYCFHAKFNFVIPSQQLNQCWSEFIKEVVHEKYISLVCCFINVFKMEIPNLTRMLKFSQNPVSSSEVSHRATTIEEEVNIFKNNLRINTMLIGDNIVADPKLSLATLLTTDQISAFGIHSFRPLLLDLEQLHRWGFSLECIATDNLFCDADGKLRLKVDSNTLSNKKMARINQIIPPSNYDKLCLLQILCEFYFRDELRAYKEGNRQKQIEELLPEFIKRFVKPLAQPHLIDFLKDPMIASAQLSDIIDFNKT